MYPSCEAGGKRDNVPQTTKCQSMTHSVSLLEPCISGKTKIQRWRLFLGGDGIGKKKSCNSGIWHCLKRGVLYYRTRIRDANGKLIALYARTPEELYDREIEALEQIDNATFHRKSPTVTEYCEKWLLMQSVHIRATTLTDYTSKVRRHIIKELGQKRMADVTLDDIQLALVPVSKKSASVYKSVVILYKSIFRAAKESHVIDENPTMYLDAKGGGVPQAERQALTDEQAERL